MKTQNQIRLDFLKLKKARNLTPSDIKFLKKMGVINGCGGSKCKLQNFFSWVVSGIFFEASCEKHDFGYWKGGDEARRKECDKKFYLAMCRDIKRQPLLFRGYFYFFAVLFYLAVRVGGKKYFGYWRR